MSEQAQHYDEIDMLQDKVQELKQNVRVYFETLQETDELLREKSLELNKVKQVMCDRCKEKMKENN